MPIDSAIKRAYHHLRDEINIDDKNKNVKRSKEEHQLQLSNNLSDVTSDDFGDDVDDENARNGEPANHDEHDNESDAKLKKCFDIINKAEKEERIDSNKANRLRDCLNSDDVIMLLLREQIPTKRPGKGYKCRVCQVPVKGHVCPYCPVCSTPQNKFEKDDDHICTHCIKCYDEGKKRKKLVQVHKTGHICPYEASVSGV